jgi:hypothetical protein
MSDRFFKLLYSDKVSFIGNIEKTETESGSWIVYVGGVRMGCVMIRVKNERDVYEGSLDMVSYDKRCNVNGDMTRGGATIDMIRAALVLTFRNFPRLQKIMLLDQSRIECGSDELYLPPLMLAVYGKTWYERNINATMEDQDIKIGIQRYIDNVSQPLSQFTAFWDNIIGYIHPNTRYSVRNGLASIWNDHTSLKSLLTYLKKDKSNCSLYIEWLYPYFMSISHIALEHQPYTIPRSNVAWPLEIEEVSENPMNRTLGSRAQKQLDIFSAFDSRKPKGTKGGAGPLYSTHNIPKKYRGKTKDWSHLD